MIQRADRAGSVVLTFPGSEQASVSAASLAVPLTMAPREVVLAAPLIAAGWARSVAAAARVEGVNVCAEPVTTADHAGFTVEVVRAERDSLRALPGWLHASLTAPEPEALDQLRAECLARLSPAERRSDTVRRTLFGDQHRYGLGHAERAAHLREVSAQELAAATAVLLRAPLVLAGSALDAAVPVVSAGPAQTGPLNTVDQAARAARRKDALAAGGTRRKPDRERGTVRIPGERACYLAGTPGVALGSEAKFPLHVAWAMLGGRDGLLDQRLRCAAALTYSLAAFSRELADGGYGMFFAGCRPEVLDDVAAGVKGTVQRLCAGDISSAMLRSAQERLIIQQHRALQTERGLAERLCGYEIAGLGPDWIAEYPKKIAAVTAADVQAAAGAYLAPGFLLETWMVPG